MKKRQFFEWKGMEADNDVDWNFREQWMFECHGVLVKVLGHPFVSPKSRLVVADFVTDILCRIGYHVEDYVSVIKEPIDLSSLEKRLLKGEIADATEFVQKLKLVFENAAAYAQSRDQSTGLTFSSVSLNAFVEKCEYLAKYVEHLCVEMVSDLRKNKERFQQDRMLFLRQTKIQRTQKVSLVDDFKTAQNKHKVFEGNVFVDKCVAFMDAFERSAATTVREKKTMSVFYLPVDVAVVSDYCTFVRTPKDLSTIKYLLTLNKNSFSNLVWSMINTTKTLDDTCGYSNFAEFLEDLTTVFENAIAYNQHYKDVDMFSNILFQYAGICIAKLKAQVPLFTLDLMDNLETDRLKRSEEKERQKQAMLKRQKEIEEEKAYRKQKEVEMEIEELKKKSVREQRKQEQEEFLQKLAKELVLRKSKPQEACADDDIERDCVTPGGPDYNSSSNSICDESDFDDEWYSDCKRRKVPNQWIPERFDAHFEPLFDKKVKIRKTAWNYLFPVIQKSELK